MPPPSKAEWIATLRCNLRCSHCLAGAGRKAAGELDTRESLKLLGELAELGVRDMCLSGGEFTLRPDWEELLACALARFPRTVLITNGFLGRRLVDAVAALRGGELAITVSLDGGRQAHDARRGAGSFDKAVEVLGARTRRRMSVLTAVDRANLGELERIAEINRSLGVEEWFIQPCLPLGRMAPEGFVGEAGLKAIADFVRLARQRFGFKVELGPSCWFGRFHPVRKGGPERGCPAGVDQLVVMPAGELLACALVPAWTFGSVRSGALRDAWRGPELDAVRRSRPSGCAVMRRLFGRQFGAIE